MILASQAGIAYPDRAARANAPSAFAIAVLPAIGAQKAQPTSPSPSWPRIRISSAPLARRVSGVIDVKDEGGSIRPTINPKAAEISACNAPKSSKSAGFDSIHALVMALHRQATDQKKGRDESRP